MRFLSNLFSRGDSANGLILAARVPLERLSDALQSLLSLPGQRPDMSQMVAFTQSARARHMDLTQIRVALQGSQLVYAMYAGALPGRTLMIISGTPETPEAAEGARILLAEVLDDYANADLAMMQVLVEPRDTSLLGIYESMGFYRLAELIYLEAEPRRLLWKLPGDGWEMLSYSPATHAQFAETILASYEGTLDCPGLNGLRSIDDIIAGHKGSGEFEPQHWHLIRHNGRPAAVLLLARVPASDALELVYIGLCPWARGKGLASELMKFSLLQADELNCGRLTTAVDARNTPAMQVYFRAGMRKVGSRIALIKVPAPKSPACPQFVPK